MGAYTMFRILEEEKRINGTKEIKKFCQRYQIINIGPIFE